MREFKRKTQVSPKPHTTPLSSHARWRKEDEKGAQPRLFSTSPCPSLPRLQAPFCVSDGLPLCVSSMCPLVRWGTRSWRPTCGGTATTRCAGRSSAPRRDSSRGSSAAGAARESHLATHGIHKGPETPHTHSSPLHSKPTSLNDTSSIKWPLGASPSPDRCSVLACGV